MIKKMIDFTFDALFKTKGSFCGKIPFKVENRIISAHFYYFIFKKRSDH